MERLQGKSKKRSQLPWFALGLGIMLIIGVCLMYRSPMLALIWGLGMVLGFAYQRSRFCFTSAFRDLFLIRNTTMIQAVLLILAICTIGFAWVQYRAAGAALPGLVHPVSWGTAIGGILFGLGMVIAGSCASGALVRLAEGFLMQWLVVIGVLAGSTLGAYHHGWWVGLGGSTGLLHLPSLIGWPGALLVQLGILAAFYLLLGKMDRQF